MHGQALLAAVGGAIAAGALAVSTATEQPVRATRLAELYPIASGPYLAWAQGRRPVNAAHHLAVYVRRPNGHIIRVTRRDGWGLPGSIEGQTLALVEYLRRHYEHGRFLLYDLRTGQRHVLKIPRKAPFELQPPQLSGHYLLYSGYSQIGSGTWLRSLLTRREKQIAPGYLRRN